MEDLCHKVGSRIRMSGFVRPMAGVVLLFQKHMVCDDYRLDYPQSLVCVLVIVHFLSYSRDETH